jgi:hypothetical protein
MSKSRLCVAVATAALLISGGSSEAFAQVVGCVGNSLVSTTLPVTYHGYSNNPAEPGAKGTSAAVTRTSTVTKWNSDCTGTTTTKTVSKHYIDGPGKSDYSKHDSIISTTCAATGTAVCP